MRYLTPAELLDAVAVVLREDVVPECGDRFAVGQLWAAIGILENLATRVVESPAIVLAECYALQEWLVRQGVDVDTEVGPLPDDGAERLRLLRDRTRAVVEAAEPSVADDLHPVLAELSELDKAAQRPINFVAAFE
jgi:hypothetical protein